MNPLMLTTLKTVMDYQASNYINSIFGDEVPEIISLTGGRDFYDGWLYDNHGFTTVYEPLEIIRRQVLNVLTANAYKYKHLYDTITVEYSLTDPINRTTTETHSGRDTTTEDNGSTSTPSGAERTTHATTQATQNTEYSTTYDSQIEKETGRSNVTYNNYDELSFTNRSTTVNEDKDKTLTHGHVITTEYKYYREPQSEIQSERQIAMFSLQMTIIGDILDAIAIPVYIDYNKQYSMPY